jgi:nucleoside-diphosphate-sugar epimerase
MKHVFITGAGGFIGGYVVNRFMEEGWHVLALVHRRTSAFLAHLSDIGAVTIINGDVKDVADIKTKLVAELQKRRSDLDVIVHCAGRASDVGWRSEFRRTNFEAVKGLVQAVKDMNVKRLVFVSTTDVYGLRDFNGESEDELLLKARPGNPYPEFKIAAEEFIRAELPSDRFSIIRPAQVWGVGDQTLTSRIVDFLKWSPWIIHFGKWRGQNRWPLAHVQNVALTIFLAATVQDAVGKAVNVVDDERTTMDEFYRILAKVYLPHKNFKTVTLPFWIGQCVGCVVSCISNMLNLDQPFTDPSFYALYSVSHNLDFSNRKMKTLIAKAGYSLVTRDSGIHEIETAASTMRTPHEPC